MRLTELEPAFLKITELSLQGTARSYRVDATREEADGLGFLCPVCFVANGGRVGTHQVICWRPLVPQTVTPNPGRWEIEGATFEDLSLVAGSSSVLLMGGCNAHFFVRRGEIVLT